MLTCHIVHRENSQGQQPYPRRPPIQTSRFFDGFDPHSPPGRNSHTATTTRNTNGFKNTMNRLFSRSSAPHDHTPPRRSIPLVDVFATRGKHRTANRHTGERDKKLQQQRPPRKQAHTGASSSSAPPAGTSNVDGATLATLQTGSANAPATTTHPSPLAEHDSDTTCFSVLTGCFPRLSRTRQTSPSASSSR
ncbi:hypothetical protein CY34DRAFT_14967 [Suillus luteus UH-Slu-Lm8-n1]|uniref:Uncharacterized protein n=1 Tax=Suillus luteus UH-Slu-Lm8-n1 TaxID=930992 RepID=A0A0C9ZLY6_9AGAM|nr:hypothetical protein CY34DRAFT_14967 [Suillus luteus UH-Slu-Lm8-n1]